MQFMATAQGNSTEAAILSRLIRPEEDDLPNEAAQAMLRLSFDRQDLDRIHELVMRNQGSPARCWHGFPRISPGFRSSCAVTGTEIGPVGRERLGDEP